MALVGQAMARPCHLPGHSSTMSTPSTAGTVLRTPGLLLGIGLGGFVDGIVLHQILQWHHMLTGVRTPDTVPGLRINTLWDGLFHVVAWLFVLAGIGVLYSRVTRDRGRAWTSRALWGWVLAGWGVFNLVEGLIDHQILGVHHVREGAHRLWWDLGFLVFGAVLVVAGWAIQRSGARADLADAAR
jgi:uncharacterized membrane protein